jgi:hypothetical protein
MAVALYGIVEHLNKIKYLGLNFCLCRVDLSPGDALFKCSKKAFSDRVVVALTPATHRRLKVILAHKPKLVRTAVLAALIAVNEHCILRLALPHRHY